ncbi:DUF2711 family protein [Neobacillus citreus]|uniref:DUF2711 domain-containing protein n=1 Tax=Neobacillus citreus TaxID=2833578 RepID=A0A942T2P1_9BACI|nr:DUF2711 family protein [Neobacillus citreus]MCH6266576.1 DUF2711 domain-containing protein [Neobacillus citreus]
MLDYIWLDDKSPILSQLPNNFKSAAILLHPFVQMPLGWRQNKQIHQEEDDYPTEEEILKQGSPVLWKTVMKESGLKSFEELEIALLTSIYALKKKFARSDLAVKLNLNLNKDRYYPTEDKTSVFLINGLLKVLSSKGADKIYFSEPIFDNSGILKIKHVSSIDISGLSPVELIITDENMDYAFMSVYDSFNTLFLSKGEDVKEVVQKMNWEAIVCDDNTFINWYLRSKDEIEQGTL